MLRKGHVAVQTGLQLPVCDYRRIQQIQIKIQNHDLVGHSQIRSHQRVENSGP